MFFFCPGFCLKASPKDSNTWLRVQAGPTNKPGIIVYVWVFHGYPQLTRSLRTAYRVPYAKNTTISMKEGLKKDMPFILLLSCWSLLEIAFIHIRLTQLTRKHTPQFCLRILTRLKVLLTQPFDMSNPFCKQSTWVLNADLTNSWKLPGCFVGFVRILVCITRFEDTEKSERIR